jgi:hypothetical protein
LKIIEGEKSVTEMAINKIIVIVIGDFSEDQSQPTHYTTYSIPGTALMR